MILGQPPSRRNARSWSRAQIAELERSVRSRTALRLYASVNTNKRTRRYFPVAGLRTIGPSP
jgi:hypothetical protein